MGFGEIRFEFKYVENSCFRLCVTSLFYPPFVIAGKEPVRYAGVNLVGLRRRGFARETIEAIHEAYRIIYSQGVLKDGVAMAREQFPDIKEVEYICSFIENSKRGVIR